MLPQCLPTFFYRSTTGNTSKCWILLGSFTQVFVCLVFKHHVVSAADPICPFSLCCRRMLPNYGWFIFGTLPKLRLARILVRCGKTWVLPNSILEVGGLWSVAKTHVSNTNLFNGDVLQENAKRYPKITCFPARPHSLRDQTRATVQSERLGIATFLFTRKSSNFNVNSFFLGVDIFDRWHMDAWHANLATQSTSNTFRSLCQCIKPSNWSCTPLTKKCCGRFRSATLSIEFVIFIDEPIKPAAKGRKKCYTKHVNTHA